jgi:transposase InsO family protein
MLQFHDHLAMEYLRVFEYLTEGQDWADAGIGLLIEYNLSRPHQYLGYLVPIEYIEKKLAKICCPVLPMWSASTLG